MDGKKETEYTNLLDMIENDKEESQTIIMKEEVNCVCFYLGIPHLIY